MSADPTENQDGTPNEAGVAYTGLPQEPRPMNSIRTKSVSFLGLGVGAGLGVILGLAIGSWVPVLIMPAMGLMVPLLSLRHGKPG